MATRNILVLAGLAATVMTAGAIATPAMADVVDYTLNTANISGTAPFGTVEVNLIGGLNTNEAVITFTANTAGGYYFFGMGSAAVNSDGAATISNITGDTSGTYSVGSPGHEDGFGSFSNRVDTTDGFKDRSSTISFDLTLVTGTWTDAAAVLTDNGNGYLAAAQFGECNSTTKCTGFSNTGYAAGGPATPVPEPPSLALLGTALVGLGLVGFVRRRRCL